MLWFIWECITFNGVDRLIAFLAVWLFETSVMILGPLLKHLSASCVAIYLAVRRTITNLAIVDCLQCRQCELPGAWPVCIGHQIEQAASSAVLQDPLGETHAGHDDLLDSDCNDGEKRVDGSKAISKRHGPYGMPDNWDDSDSDDAQDEDKGLESETDPTSNSKCGEGEKKGEETKSAPAPRRRNRFGMPENCKGYWDSASDDAQGEDKGMQSNPDRAAPSGLPDKGEAEAEKKKEIPKPKARVVHPSVRDLR